MKKRTAEKLVFEPTIFRDWSLSYCELAWISATKIFREQFNWSYSDFIFLWDGKKEILYRAREEHYHKMFKFISKQIIKKKNFIKKISLTLVKDITRYKRLLNNWLKLNLNKLNNEELLEILNELKKNYLPILPRFLIIMYFPQQVEQYYIKSKDRFKKELKICLTTREKVDKILAPLTEKFLRKFTNQLLKNYQFKNFKKLGKFLSLKEIERLLKKSYSKKQIIKLEKKLKKRQNYFLLAGGKIKQTSLKTYLKKQGWGLTEYKAKSKVDIIKGKAAYKTTEPVRGKLKIVENKEKLSKIKKGDIIVAPMTTPEYAPVFKKIKAIITDEGGITSHAAIAAREFKIPCIIGTKIATKVLKDGYFIELDTNKALIKILKR